ncbi:MAG: hypothetical protein JWL57_3056 [Actinobacteria bacterium]|nr:hypothetical protein [Actinomycetota bacterium]
MNDLPASWAPLGPYLFVAAAAVVVAASALGARQRKRQPAPPVAGEEATRLWTVTPPWEPALRRAGAATRRVSRDPLLAALGPAALGLTAFGLAIGRQPVVVFLGLFMIPTVALAPGVLRGRSAPAPFISFAASDLSLVLGLVHRHAATGIWTTPAPGHVGAGALLVALAAGLRLGGVAAGPDLASLPAPTQAGWFQGLFLAWWAGPSTAAALALVAVALWAGGVAMARGGRQESGLLFAGGLAALLAGLGAGAATLTAVGLAGTSFAMGDRAISMATLGLAPLSAPAVAVGILPALRPWIPAALGFFVVAVAIALHLLLDLPTVRARARLVPAGAAATVTAVLLAARGAETVVWAVYGLGLAGVVAALAVRPANMHYGGETPADTWGPDEDAGLERPGLGSVREAALAALGGALLVVALLMVGQLTVTGLRTNFL